MKTHALIPAAALSLIALVAACGGAATVDDAADLTGGGATQAAASAVGSAPGFPTGPAITVSAGYEAPTDRVASTGAYIPANGKPTLVYVDAIW